MYMYEIYIPGQNCELYIGAYMPCLDTTVTYMYGRIDDLYRLSNLYTMSCAVNCDNGWLYT